VSIKAFIILDSEGKRIISKYYSADIPTKDQRPFERTLFEKTKRMQSDIVMMDGLVVCYKMQTDVWFYAVCGTEENEVMVGSVVNGYYDALTILLAYVFARYSTCSEDYIRAGRGGANCAKWTS